MIRVGCGEIAERAVLHFGQLQDVVVLAIQHQNHNLTVHISAVSGKRVAPSSDIELIFNQADVGCQAICITGRSWMDRYSSGCTCATLEKISCTVLPM